MPHQILCSRQSSLAYLFWLLAPLAFLALLAPEALLVAGIALVEVLASNYIWHYYIFERYAAPIVPFVFLAAALGAYRLSRLLQRFPRIPTTAVLTIAVLSSTVVSQLALHKFTFDTGSVPDGRVLAALEIARGVRDGRRPSPIASPGPPPQPICPRPIFTKIGSGDF